MEGVLAKSMNKIEIPVVQLREKLHERDSFYREKKYLDLFIQHLKPKASVLDVGCGFGFPRLSQFNYTSMIS